MSSHMVRELIEIFAAGELTEISGLAWGKDSLHSLNHDGDFCFILELGGDFCLVLELGRELCLFLELGGDFCLVIDID